MGRQVSIRTAASCCLEALLALELWHKSYYFNKKRIAQYTNGLQGSVKPNPEALFVLAGGLENEAVSTSVSLPLN